jgi:hypothetical protein
VKVNQNDPPRVFDTGVDGLVKMSDCGRIDLEPDEQVTMTTEAGSEYDVARKSWGFYVTPSLNDRLLRSGLRGALASNVDKRFFVLLVEDGREADLDDYLEREQMRIVCWLDDDTLERIDGASAP